MGNKLLSERRRRRVPGVANPPTILHERIRYEREVAGFQIGELARIIGVSEDTLSNIELGKTPVDAQLVQTIARALGITIARAMGEGPDPHAARRMAG